MIRHNSKKDAPYSHKKELVIKVLKEYMKDDLTIAQIAEKYDIHPATVHKWSRKAEVEYRTRRKRYWNSIKESLKGNLDKE